MNEARIDEEAYMKKHELLVRVAEGEPITWGTNEHRVTFVEVISYCDAIRENTVSLPTQMAMVLDMSIEGWMIIAGRAEAIIAERLLGAQQATPTPQPCSPSQNIGFSQP